MTYTFAVPTIMNDPEMEIRNVEKIAEDYPDSKVYFISNIEDDTFREYTPRFNNIIKLVGGLKYSISRALNSCLDKIEETDFFVFVQSDVTFDTTTLDVFTDIASKDSKCGVVGITRRSNFNRFNKRVDLLKGIDSYKVLWTDGIMFMTTNLAKEFKFDESYFGDKESQDLCYRLHDAGYNNYYVSNVKHAHISKSFDNKLKVDKQEFLETVKQTRAIFKSKWSKWEDSQPHTFV